MDWDRVAGNWKQVKGKVKEKWGKLTDDDLNVIDVHAQLKRLPLRRRARFGLELQSHPRAGVAI